MRPLQRWKMTLVVVLAIAAWLLPLVWSLQRQRGARAKAVAEPAAPPVPSAGGEVKPLILYVEAWPTRAKLDLREIQGLTNESETTLAPAQVADNLYSALGRMGITPEIHRIDRLPADAELARFNPVVVVYPVRHGRPAAEVGTFFDQRVERFIARRKSGAGPVFSDVVISESPEEASAAQRALNGMTGYYGLSYTTGPRLGPQVSVYQERQLLDAQAAAVRRVMNR